MSLVYFVQGGGRRRGIILQGWIFFVIIKQTMQGEGVFNKERVCDVFNVGTPAVRS